eukprot:Rmarinus@m.6500
MRCLCLLAPYKPAFGRAWWGTMAVPDAPARLRWSGSSLMVVTCSSVVLSRICGVLPWTMTSVVAVKAMRPCGRMRESIAFYTGRVALHGSASPLPPTRGCACPSLAPLALMLPSGSHTTTSCSSVVSHRLVWSPIPLVLPLPTSWLLSDLLLHMNCHTSLAQACRWLLTQLWSSFRGMVLARTIRTRTARTVPKSGRSHPRFLTNLWITLGPRNVGTTAILGRSLCRMAILWSPRRSRSKGLRGLTSPPCITHTETWMLRAIRRTSFRAKKYMSTSI